MHSGRVKPYQDTLLNMIKGLVKHEDWIGLCIVINSKISLGFDNPVKTQTFTNTSVHPAEMGSWEQMWPYSAPLLAASKTKICESEAISNDQQGNCKVGR